MSEKSFITVGQLFVQNDWYEALRLGGKAWVSSSIEGQQSIYGEVSAIVCSDERRLQVTEGFQVENISKRIFLIKSINHNIDSYFFAPWSTYANVHDKAVRCLDVSPGGGLAVSCGDDEGLFIWQTNDGVTRRSLNGHISDVTTCQFFPSGFVVLSGGVDMRLRIWSIEDGSCPVVLSGHTAAITCTEVVDKGRNIISCSRDGRSLLWDCGTSKCLSELTNCSAVINSSCMIQYRSSDGKDGVPNRDKREYGTDGKLLVVGREDGVLDAVDVHNRETMFSYQCDSPVNSCCFVGDATLVAGLESGCINYFDLRNTHAPYKIMKYGKSSVTCLKEFQDDSLLIGRRDGSTSCVRIKDGCESLTMELSGPDCDPIYSISTHENFVYTACRDRRLRKYKLELNT